MTGVLIGLIVLIAIGVVGVLLVAVWGAARDGGGERRAGVDTSASMLPFMLMGSSGNNDGARSDGAAGVTSDAPGCDAGGSADGCGCGGGGDGGGGGGGGE
ncbi:MAG TPA: hypothetical protein VD971_00520 [Phycisphaerales bacterium]|nr:hypothetical protein [Phycisphaerales bacterium]